MRALYHFVFLLLVLLLCGVDGHAQPDSSGVKKHRMAITYGNGYMPGAALRSNALFASIPKLGFVYERRFNTRLGVSLMSDMELVTYTVNEREPDEFERQNAWATCVAFNAHFGALALFAGAGYELEKQKDQVIGRVGVQYAFLPGNDWDITPLVWADLKEVHTAIVLGVTVGRSF